MCVDGIGNGKIEKLGGKPMGEKLKWQIMTFILDSYWFFEKGNNSCKVNSNNPSREKLESKKVDVSVRELLPP